MKIVMLVRVCTLYRWFDLSVIAARCTPRSGGKDPIPSRGAGGAGGVDKTQGVAVRSILTSAAPVSHAACHNTDHRLMKCSGA